jgi:hypothetical protein
MAAGSTYTPIATTTLGAAQTSYTFTSISGSYTDLYLVIAGSGAVSGGNTLLQFNSDTGTNYSATILYGDGSSAGSARASSASSMNIGDLDATSQSNTLVSIMNYANTTTYKTALGRSNRLNAGAAVAAKVGLWRSTAAITSIKVFFSSADVFTSGTTLTLYGIAAA